MQLILPLPKAKRLQRELKRAGAQEIGGLLMGEHVQDEVFRIADVSIQRSGGTNVCFIRHPEKHRHDLDAFFARTEKDYERFNYLGEWHSHPSFEPLPSNTDIATMQSISEDPTVGAHFVVLMIVRLSDEQTLDVTATAFRSGIAPMAVRVIVEGAPSPEQNGLFKRWLKGVLRL